MASVSAWLFRLFLAWSLVLLPWTQTWSMAFQQPDQPSPCHAKVDTPAPDQSHGGGCCAKATCHCIAAIALPSTPVLGSSPDGAVWIAWVPGHPSQPDFAPTPPPPRT